MESLRLIRLSPFRSDIRGWDSGILRLRAARLAVVNSDELFCHVDAQTRSTPLTSRFMSRFGITPAAILGAFAIATTAPAQQVLVPVFSIPPEQLQPPPENIETNRPGTTGAAPAPSIAPRYREPFQWGPITLHPHLVYTFTYGNGIQSAPGASQKTALNQIAPGIGFDLGTHWKLDYTPTIMLYSDPAFKNTVNQFIGLSGTTSYEAWTFNLLQNCMLTSDPLVQTAQQTEQEDYLTSLSAAYRLNSNTTLELSAMQDLRYAQGFTDTATWSTIDWLNFQTGPHVGVAGGVGAGYVHMDGGSDMTYEQIQGRIGWRVVRKINLTIQAGVEVMQFLNSPEPDLVTPIFDVSLNYQPFDTTVIILSAARTVSASYFQDQVAENTGFNVSISQRFLEHFYLGAYGGYANTLYHATIPGAPSGRDDNYANFGVSLSTTFLRRGTASVFYSASRNVSNDPGFGYSSDQIGLRLAFSY
jgi:hypothetical protein